MSWAGAGSAFAAATIDLQKTVYIGQDGGASCPGSEQVTVTAGTPITYYFMVRNTGTTTFTSAQLSDGALGVSVPALGGGETLAPGESRTLHAEHVVNFDLLNTAGVTALPGPATDTDTATVDKVNTTVVLEKTVYMGHNAGVGCPGSESVTGPIGSAITYCFLVRNTGETHLGDLIIDDPALGITKAQMTRLVGNEPIGPTSPNNRIVYYYQTAITTDVLNTASVTANPVLSGGGDLPGIADVTDDDTATVDEVTPTTTSITTTASTSTTTTTIPVCSCSEGVPFFIGNKASFGTGTEVLSGSVAINSDIGFLKFSTYGYMSDGTTVTANRLKLANHASVFQISTNSLTTGPTVQIRGGAIASPVLPLSPSFCAFSGPPPSCGSGDLDVSNGPGFPTFLSPGNYGNVRVGAGSELHLRDIGRFGFCSLTLWDGAALVSDQQVTIDVVGNVAIGAGASITTASGAPLILNVAGTKVNVAGDGQIDAAITAPNARVKLKQYARINGCLCSLLIKTAANTDLACIGD